MQNNDTARVAHYRAMVKALLEASISESEAEKAVLVVLETNRHYLDGRFFNLLNGFTEEAAANKNYKLADTIKQITVIARSYRASLTLQKLPKTDVILNYDPVIEALMNAQGSEALALVLQEYDEQIGEELVAVLLFRAMQARQRQRDDLVRPFVELADLVLIYSDSKSG
jgi:hypothetical protein